MIAIDTNIILRLLVNDDPEQLSLIQELLGSRSVYVPTTVILETAWVLESGYGFDKIAILDALGRFVRLPKVTLEHPQRVATALAWARSGLDIADALHLAAADRCAGFLTFDRQLVRKSEALGGTPVNMP